MLPLMEKGASVGLLTRGPEWESWREQTFLNWEQPTGEIPEKLLSDPRSMLEIRDPTIHRALKRCVQAD
jgi:hypothetical protein